MLKTLFLPVVHVGIVAAGVVAEVIPTSSARAGNASTGESDAVAQAAASKSLTGKAVTAAAAFESSLSSAQRAKLQYAFSSPKKKSGWSNLPTTFVARNGVAIKDLSSGQVAKLRTLATDRQTAPRDPA